MVTRHLFAVLSVALLILLIAAPSSFAQYRFYGPSARMFSVNGYGGSSYYPMPMMNRGYSPQYRHYPYYPSTAPHTVYLDQYHRIEYNRPGRVGMPEYIKYSNNGPHPNNRTWSRRGY